MAINSPISSLKRHLQVALESNRIGQMFFDLIALIVSTVNTLRGEVPSSATWVWVETLDNLPDAVAGVRTLADDVTYVLTTEIDLLGDRLMSGSNSPIIGGSSENCGLISTGLSPSLALLSSTCSMPLRHIYITHDIALDLDGQTTDDAALDWGGVNFIDCGVVGTIKNYDNVIIKAGAFIGSGALTIDGAIDTFAFEGCFFNIPANKKGVIISSTCTISRRFRTIYSAFAATPASSTGIEVEDVASFVNNQSFILDTVAFSGDGTYLDGISRDDNESLISGSGVPNSADLCQYVMSGNVVTTAMTVQGTFYKVAGTTSAGAISEKFDCATVTNRAIYQGALETFFKVSVLSTYSDGNNQQIAIAVAKNGVVISDSASRNSTGAGGRAEGAGAHAIVSLKFDDYIEIWAANETSAGSSLEVSDLNVIVERI